MTEHEKVRAVELMRQLRDGINDEIADMTFEEQRRWLDAQLEQSSLWQRLERESAAANPKSR
ncbi:MAG TPA: hypothetical protein VGF69_16725 [Thermoanaerobaculia bacterium]|jgi:hypothetical protein